MPKKSKARLSDDELRMIIKVVLSTLHQTIKDCKTYDEFKEFINYIWRNESKNE